MKERGAIFRQSQQDFPCFVELGKNNPSFGINRWGNNALRFVPYDDEGFTLRGDKRRLLYKGRRRSHRFTILNDGTFEYDCILLREPESNVITLRMEGAENYDFFRQPDFVPDDFLKGSYAVYKKDTLIGEGTGKLCHIHRPLIIDSRGCKVWGELSVVGNELRITIPEWWLASAKYPVTVDPTIGTTTVGSQYIYYNIDNEDDYELMYELSVPVNRFLLSEKLDGLCTAYFYVNSDDNEAGGRGVIYSDNNNKPLTRRSKDENFIDMRVNTSKPKGWRTGTFRTNTSIASGSYIWFGCFCEYYWMPRFDWGVKCYRGWWADDYDGIPNTYNYNDDWYYDFKLSMYFTYTSAQNYVRTLTQGINLTDARKTTGEYKRTLPQTSQITDNRNIKADYKREAIENVNGSTSANAMFTFFRQCFETVSNSIGFSRLPVFNRFVNDDIKANSTIKDSREINRKCDDVINNSDVANRSQGFIRTVTENIFSDDNKDFSILFLRTLHETQRITDTFQQVRDYIRCLRIETVIIAETERSGDFFRTHSDTVNVDGFSFRHLLIFIKLFSASMVRDFILKRFLVSKEQIELKSLITKDLRIESKIN